MQLCHVNVRFSLRSMMKLIWSSCAVMLKPFSNPPAFHSYQKTIKTETFKSLWWVFPTLTSVVSQHCAAVWHQGLCGVDKHSYPIQSKRIWVWKVFVFLLGRMYSIDYVGYLTWLAFSFWKSFSCLQRTVGLPWTKGISECKNILKYQTFSFQVHLQSPFLSVSIDWVYR